MKIEVKNLVRQFGAQRAVDDISFSFESGNIFGFIGPNGAGKTTTIRMMVSLDLPDAGDIYYDGVSAVTYPDQIHRIIGYMPDSLPEYRDITVWEYLDFFARAYGLKGEKRTKTIQYIEEFTNLGELREKILHTLSKGMKQRVSLARALIHNPEVLIMDEPAAGLDPRARLEFRELLKIFAGQKKAVFLSSHILSELQDMCDGAVIIERGKILSAGKIEDLLTHADKSRDAQMPLAVQIQPLDEANAAKICLYGKELPFVLSIEPQGGHIVANLDGNDEKLVAELLTHLAKKNCLIVNYQINKASLEQIFMEITRGLVQ